MNKKGYKRIIGLFIFALTIMLCNIINVSANECNEVSNETLLNRYGLSVDYDDTEETYKLQSDFNAAEIKEMFKSFDTSKIKFKIAELYFYEPYSVEVDDNGKPIETNITDADNIKKLDTTYVEKYDGSIDTLVNNGIIGTLNLGKNSTIKVKESVFDYRKDENKTGLAFKIVPDGFNDPEVEDKCGKKSTFFAIVHVAYEKGEDEEPEILPSDIDGITVDESKWLDCNNYQSYNKNSFAYKFCADKDASVGIDGSQKKAGTQKFTIEKDKNGRMIKYEDGNKQINPGTALPFKCDYTVKANGTTGTSSADGSEYYVNKKYLYGEGTIKINLGQYRYTGEYANTKVATASCEIKCEEVVKVEYGPPVASKAGLCFEYKVKVTSRVNCEGKTPTAPPKQVVCTPTPYCKHKNGKVWHMAGPNEDFDECVQSCDGGKYSDKCVNKCYKQVYGESIVRQTTGYEIAYEDTLALDTGINSIDVLYEYKMKDGKIVWDVGGTTTRKKSKTKGGTRQDWSRAVSADSYWHRHHKWGNALSTYNLYTKQGIPEKLGCDDLSCWWKANTKGECGKAGNYRYLNHPNVYKKTYTKNGRTYTRKDGKDYSGQSDYELDRKYNKELYDRLVTQCKAYASCNTTTAEFTISASYTEKGKTTKQTINFPYTENNDKNAKDTIKNNDTTTACPTDIASTTILSSAGCYNCSSNGIDTGDTEKDEAGKKKMYMTEWSFPGTWIHNKTGKISYKPVSTGAWRKIKEKFCLPLNVANTNAKWYNYYQAQINGSDTSYTYNNPDYIRNIQCPDGTEVKNVCEYKNSQFGSDDEKEIDYNINASTRKFGWYEWDIDISCFYAINDLFPKVKETDNCSLLTCSSEKYRIRSVDLGNLFPAKEGEDASRNPGFNWTSFASQTAKDANYKSTPSNYATWIQAKGTDVYSDNYLDYEVNLTKEDISNIKKTVNGVLNKNYTDWQGETEVNSVVNYKSTLIRQTLTNTKYPGDEALKCNNIGDHTPAKNYSARCEEFSNKEGK